MIRTNVYRAFQQQLLSNETEHQHRLLRCLIARCAIIIQQLEQSVSNLDFIYLYIFSNITSCRIYDQTNINHNRNLKSLGYDPSVVGKLDDNSVIFYLSNVQLTNTEKSVLSEGLKFALTRNKVSFVEHFLPFENCSNNYMSMRSIILTKGQISLILL